MKKVFFITILASILLYHCNWFESSTKSKNSQKSVQFLALYKPGNANVLGNTRLTALIEAKNGNANYSTFLDIYPYGDKFWAGCAINNNKLAMGLHYDFNEDKTTRGVIVDLSSKAQADLPIVTVEAGSEYPYYQSHTARISDNGMVLYLSATNNRYYGDTYKPYLIRYNPADGTHIVASSPGNFAVNQPERGNDTETGQFNRNVAISPDGRYAYGVVEAFGVSGNIHWDYDILFQYDFETNQFTRLGEEGDADVSFYGLSRDGKKLFYANGGTRKIHDLITGVVSEFSIYATAFHPIQSSNNGFCRNATTGIYYNDCVNNQETKIVSSYYTRDAQFSEDGNSIYFTIDGYDVNYICETVDLQENTEWDTLASVPKELYEFMLLK